MRIRGISPILMKMVFRSRLKTETQVHKEFHFSKTVNYANAINPRSARIRPSSGENVFPDCSSIWVIFSLDTQSLDNFSFINSIRLDKMSHIDAQSEILIINIFATGGPDLSWGRVYCIEFGIVYNPTFGFQRPNTEFWKSLLAEKSSSWEIWFRQY